MLTLSVHAPRLGASLDVKDSFYEALAHTVRLMNIDEPLFILEDFNARVRNQRIYSPRALGCHGIGKMNENGQRLLEFSIVNDLAIANTFFALTDQHKVSWCHPVYKHWHQIDHILAKKIALICIRVRRSFLSADCDMDYTRSFLSAVCLFVGWLLNVPATG